jgi:radical SAM-linked protein
MIKPVGIERLKEENEQRQRFRSVFSKGEELKYISHLDLARAWERALRRADLPMLYSYGFHPQPKMQFASTLPVGYTSRYEIVDVYLCREMPVQELQQRLPEVMPRGITISSVEEVELRAPALQACLTAADYSMRIECHEDGDEIRERTQKMLSGEHLVVEKVKKEEHHWFDARPFILDFRFEGKEKADAVFWLKLRHGSQGHVRPDQLAAAMGLADNYRAIERLMLHFIFDNNPS